MPHSAALEPSAFVAHSAALGRSAFVAHSAEHRAAVLSFLDDSAARRAESVVRAAERLAAEGEAAAARFIVVPMVVDDVRVVEFVEPVAVDIDLAAAPVEAAP
jgi:hypothetical protein